MNSYTEMAEQRLRLYSQALLNREQNKLELFSNKIDNADPSRILQLGFTITRVNGKAVNDAALLKEGDVIDTVFANGSVTSVVQTNKTK